MRLQLTHDEELFFLHFLDVTEEDFQALKAEQGIVVDFQSFPEKVVSLLDRCTGPEAPWPPRSPATPSGCSAVTCVLKLAAVSQVECFPHNG